MTDLSRLSPSESRDNFETTTYQFTQDLRNITKHFSVPIEIQKQHSEQNMYIRVQLFSV